MYWIPEIAPLRLAQMARPRAGDWLERDIANWRSVGIDAIVSLLEPSEAYELGLSDEQAVCARHGIEFISFPIADRGTPDSSPKALALVAQLTERVRRGDGVAVHCRAGIGRSGMVCASVLLCLGVPFDDVFPMLTRARRVQVPDTADQVEWVRQFSGTVGTSVPQD